MNYGGCLTLEKCGLSILYIFPSKYYGEVGDETDT
jgi:hypothetical protein